MRNLGMLSASEWRHLLPAVTASSWINVRARMPVNKLVKSLHARD